jgi:hypothetical protein
LFADDIEVGGDARSNRTKIKSGSILVIKLDYRKKISDPQALQELDTSEKNT